jgi:hypothetical protein
MTPPPRSPILALDEKPGGHLRLNLKLIAWTAVTIFITAWFCTMGPIPAVLSLVVAKHILVAILMMGAGVDRRGKAAA